jgi:ribonuclease P protein component
VQTRGQKIHSGPLLVCVLPNRNEKQLRIGITTSKKTGKAVFRNRLRRLIRDAARRLLLVEELAFDVVVITKKNIPTEIKQEAIDRAILKLVRRLYDHEKKQQTRNSS